MESCVISKFLFTITFPPSRPRRVHVPLLRLHSLATRDLPDMEVIETIDHLFKCTRCLENYRLVRSGYQDIQH